MGPMEGQGKNLNISLIQPFKTTCTQDLTMVHGPVILKGQISLQVSRLTPAVFQGATNWETAIWKYVQPQNKIETKLPIKKTAKNTNM